MDRPPSRQALLGRIIDPRDGSEIDEAIVLFFPSPNSYTGEDMIEYSLHGSPVLIAALLDCLCSLGARLAEPGEFTMRAFLRGRIDLTQAEAVRDIIEATSLYQAQVAGRQRSGALARQLQPVKESLIDIIVNLESTVEFVEEDLPAASRKSLTQQLEQARRQLRIWVDSYRQGRVIRDGFSMAVVGRPNVGKSSVFNALLAQDRSIVTEVPGTTRDLVSECMNLGGVPVRLQDTAGLHHSDDLVENLGMDRSFQAINDADVILLVVDTSLPLSHHDVALRQELSHLSCIAVLNKSDLPMRWSYEEKKEFAGDWPCVEVSAKTGSRVEILRSVILDGILGSGGISRDGIIVTNLRHCHNLEGAERDLAHAELALRDGLSEEFALIDLHTALKKLGAITGETHAEDLLKEIFSRFCIGK
jgi:tRNA modification GTPase